MVKPIGKGRLKIMVVGGPISLAAENSNNTNQGSHYLYLKKRFKEIGVSLEDDCWYIPAIRCYTTNDKYGVKTMNACATLLQNDVRNLKPSVIVVTDNVAWEILLSARMEGSRGSGSLWEYAGYFIPDQDLNAWVVPLYATNLLIENENEMKRKKEEYGDRYTPPDRFEPHYSNILKQIPEYLNKPIPKYDWKDKVVVCSTVEEAYKVLDIVDSWPIFAFDYETTGLAWHRKEHQIYSISFSNRDICYAMRWYKNDVKFMEKVKKVLTNKAIKIAHNMAFERAWTIGRAGVEPTNLIHDPMLMAHAYRNLSPTSLKYLLYRHFGILGYDTETAHYLEPSNEEERKYGKNALNTIFEAPVQKVLLYNGYDSLFTFWLYEMFMELLDHEHELPGYRLLAKAERSLTRMHLQGVKIDMEALHYWKPILQKRIDDQYTIIMNSDFINKVWKGANKFKPGSDADVRVLVYDILKLKPMAYTDKGLPSVDAEALDYYQDDFPIAANLLEYRRWYKVLNTFIAQLEREQWEGVIHSYFHLLIDSYRSGSRLVNLTNIPKHDKEVMQVIRSLYIPRKGHKLASCDYAQLEVRANAGITMDRNLIRSVQAGENKLDMHSEMAMKLFFMTPETKTKPARQVAKTQVFRLFYGGSGMQMAEATWKQINSKKCVEIFGMDMKSHIYKQGIANYDQWNEHCVKVERWLWGDMFPDYLKWRKDTYNNYLQTGKLYYPNGFTYQGVASRNSLLNGPGQGAGFHVNLNAIIAIDEEMERKGMNTRLIIEIHDDIMGDVDPEEEEEYKEILYKHMVRNKNKYSPWLG